MELLVAFLSLFLSMLLKFVQSQDCTHHIVLDDSGAYHLHWSPPEDKRGDSEIIFKVEMKANGYFVLGFSRDGRIPGSDVVTGWIKDEDVYLQDRHVDASGQLLEDDQQDYELINAYKNNTSTVFEFRRKLDTCDENDMVIDGSTINMFYSYSEADPDPEDTLSLENIDWKKVILLQCNIENTVDIDFSSLLQWNLTAPDIDISSLYTYYFCRIVKSPQVSDKHHIVYVKPIIQEGHEQFLSHMSLYECIGGTPEEYEDLLDDRNFECYEPTTPVQMFRCQGLIMSWAIGSQGTVLPEHVGLPIYPAPGRYYMFEMHYHNSQLQTGIIDHSGLSLFYTSKLRKFDAGYYLIGPSPLPRLFIPPGQKQYVVVGHSDPECVSSEFQDSGANVFAMSIHTFLLGRRFKVRHFRGNRELVPIVDDKNIDHNFQPHRYFTKEVTILPNDHITTECTYDSSERINVTLGGLGRESEVCVAALLYYPLVNWSIASFSGPTFAEINKALDINVSNEADVSRILKGYDWARTDIDEVQNAMRYSEQQTQCYVGEFLKDGEHALTSYPNDIIPYEEESTCDVT